MITSNTMTNMMKRENRIIGSEKIGLKVDLIKNRKSYRIRLWFQ